jgi:hypothetical protein
MSLWGVRNQIAALRLHEKELIDALVRNQSRVEVLSQANKMHRDIQRTLTYTALGGRIHH